MKGEPYTEFRSVTVNGTAAKIGMCRRCGAAILLDPRDGFDPRQLHDQWHRRTEADGSKA